MAPAIQTYYDDSAEEENDLLELRKEHYRTLRVLQKQAAKFGGAVPAQIAAGIADAESQIAAIDEARKARILPETAERLGATGQFTLLAGRLNLLSQQLRQQQQEADRWRESVRESLADLAKSQQQIAVEWRERLGEGLGELEKSQADFQRVARMIVQAIGVALFILALALLGIGAALWTLK